VDYSVFALSALYYFNQKEERGFRRGWQPFLRAGIAFLDAEENNLPNVGVDQDNDAQFYFGGGLEYAWDSRWAVRGDIDLYDEDAAFVGISLLKRFGRENRERKPQPAIVIEEGPKDTDSDGVYDNDDQCPGTIIIEGTQVDQKGCLIYFDSDIDGVRDVDDQCPHSIPTDKVDETGCVPVVEIAQQVVKKLNVALKGVLFETNSAKLTATSLATLDRVATVLLDAKDINIEVQAYTDSRGRDSYNLQLSDKRANSVMEYLISKGIVASRMKAKGYGEAQPIVSNDTAEGRTQNRRVEFKILNDAE